MLKSFTYSEYSKNQPLKFSKNKLIVATIALLSSTKSGSALKISEELSNNA